MFLFFGPPLTLACQINVGGAAYFIIQEVFGGVTAPKFILNHIDEKATIENKKYKQKI